MSVSDAEGNVYFSDGKNDSIHFYQPGKPVTLFVELTNGRLAPAPNTF